MCHDDDNDDDDIDENDDGDDDIDDDAGSGVNADTFDFSIRSSRFDEVF